MPRPRRDIDLSVQRLAAKQAGVFTRHQVLEIGASDAIIERRLAAGIWRRRSPGVYGFAGFDDSSAARLWTACLAPDAGAVVSHESAAELHGLATFRGRHCVVTVEHARARLPGLSVVHQSRRLFADHVTTVDGLPVTTVARTIIDLAGSYRLGRMAIVLDRALAARKLTIPSFCDTFDDLACRGRSGVSLVRTLIAERDGSYVPPASVAESNLLRALRLGGLPRPVLQFPHPAPGYEERRVDAAYPGSKLLIEVDSQTWHGGWADRRRDLARDRAARAAGYSTIRVDATTLEHDPLGFAAEVRGALATAA